VAGIAEIRPGAKSAAGFRQPPAAPGRISDPRDVNWNVRGPGKIKCLKAAKTRFT